MPCATIQKTANTTENKEQDEEFAAQCALYIGAKHAQREHIQDERQIIVFEEQAGDYLAGHIEIIVRENTTLGILAEGTFLEPTFKECAKAQRLAGFLALCSPYFTKKSHICKAQKQNF